MAADFYYNDYAFRRSASKNISYERKKILDKAQKIKAKRNVRDFLAIFTLLSMFVILIYLYGQLMEVDYSLNYDKNKLNTLSVQTEEIKASIASMMSMDQIKEYAEINLGMREPSVNQVKYLSLKKDDSTITYAPAGNKNALDFLLSIFK